MANSRIREASRIRVNSLGPAVIPAAAEALTAGSFWLPEK
jgi:hypothetical protein